MNIYPTKQQILAKKIIFPPHIKTITLLWKITFFKNWNKKTNQTKLKALKTFIYTLNTQYNNNKFLIIKSGTKYKYDLTNHTIYQNQHNPSIISALHELSHHIHGPNELTACAWSIQLFKKFFPKSYKKLKWNKHLLIKQ